jgi:predicted ATPase
LITLVEALRYRSLLYVKQPLGPFHVLVGPNASGKSTFLDVIAFLGRLVSEGLETAVRERSENFLDLVFKGHPTQSFQLAIEADIPDELHKVLVEVSTPSFPPWIQSYATELRTVRYEVEVGTDSDTDELKLLHEGVWLKQTDDGLPARQRLFPMPTEPPASILLPKGTLPPAIISKRFDGDIFRPETGKGLPLRFNLGPRKSALGNLPEDESQFPVSTWLKQLLINGVQQLALNSAALRRASPPQQTRSFRPDGSNLPWVIADMRKRGTERYDAWLAHVRTALPDVEEIQVRERPDDRHSYLVIRYSSGYEVPSWLVSDGTLRMLALTLLPYLPDFTGLYLIEEPENGIHPRAVETVFESLSSAYNAQILLATHSPVILSIVDSQQVLCFAKNPDGASDIVRGDLHPALRNWKHEVSLGELFAGGVLG